MDKSGVEFEQIITSECFIQTLLSRPESQLWYVIPNLMRVSKSLRTRITSRLPELFKKMLLILGSGKPWRGPGYGIQSLTNYRDVLSKLYVSGALPVYLKYIPDADKMHACKFWGQLNMIPVDRIDQIDTLELLMTPVEICRESQTFTRCDGNGNFPGTMYQYLRQFQDRTTDRLDIRNSSDPRALIHNAFDTIRETSYREAYGGDVRTEYRALIDGWLAIYSASELSAQTRNLNYYVGSIWINRDPDFVSRFYRAFKIKMPYGLSSPGNWSRLFFCTLFDLDLAIVCNRLGEKLKKIRPNKKMEQTTGTTYEMIPLDIRNEILNLVLWDRITNHYVFYYLNLTISTVVEIRKICRVLLLGDPREVANMHIEQIRKKNCMTPMNHVFQIYTDSIWNRNDEFVLLIDHCENKIVHRGQLIHTADAHHPDVLNLIAKIWELSDFGITITPTILSWIKHMAINTVYSGRLNRYYDSLYRPCRGMHISDDVQKKDYKI